ncbi:MAG: DUF3108 domain-containing protein [Candidatus Omnitrophica bacterium]|nr:DUF3108 domain-containing protein [Candidatus Omnitrophota bacterium]
MKEYIILVSIFFFLSGCICEKKEKREKDLEQIPQVYFKEEIEEKPEEVKEEIPEKIEETEIEKEEVELKKNLKPEIKDQVAILPKEEKLISKKEKKFEEPLPEIYLKKWDGECLIYNLKWNLMNFGNAIVICLEEKESFHLTGISIPTGLPAQIGYGYNRIDSFIDKKTGKTKYFYLYTKTGGKEKITEIFFDWNAKQYTCIEKKYKNKKLYSTKRNIIKFKEDIFDSLSIFYFLRNTNLENIQNTEFPIALPEKWYLKINFKGRKIKRLPNLGEKEVFIVEPVARSKRERFKDGRMDIWITTDERNPVYFEGKVSVGKATLILSEVQKIDSKTQNDINKIIENFIKQRG